MEEEHHAKEDDMKTNKKDETKSSSSCSADEKEVTLEEDKVAVSVEEEGGGEGGEMEESSSDKKQSGEEKQVQTTKEEPTKSLQDEETAEAQDATAAPAQQEQEQQEQDEEAPTAEAVADKKSLYKSMMEREQILRKKRRREKKKREKQKRAAAKRERRAMQEAAADAMLAESAAAVKEKYGYIRKDGKIGQTSRDRKDGGDGGGGDGGDESEEEFLALLRGDNNHKIKKKKKNRANQHRYLRDVESGDAGLIEELKECANSILPRRRTNHDDDPYGSAQQHDDHDDDEYQHDPTWDFTTKAIYFLCVVLLFSIVQRNPVVRYKLHHFVERTFHHTAYAGSGDNTSYDHEVVHHQQEGIYGSSSAAKKSSSSSSSSSGTADKTTSSSSSSSSSSSFSSTTSTSVEIPERYNVISDLYEPYDELTDVPLFWRIPRSAGTTMQHAMLYCFGLVDASQLGIAGGHDQDSVLAIVPDEYGGLHVNVDTTTTSGLVRAKNMDLAESGAADVIVTGLVYDAASVFTPTHKGRMFALFRHPVDRAISLFHHLRNTAIADLERDASTKDGTRTPHDPLLVNMTIEEYAKRSQTEHNWMVRFITGVQDGYLYERHLEQAKTILKRKCLVGLVTEMEESYRRFESFFHWGEMEGKVGCRKMHLTEGFSVQSYEKVEEESAAWQHFKRRNDLDIRLYEYVEELFKTQAVLFSEE